MDFFPSHVFVIRNASQFLISTHRMWYRRHCGKIDAVNFIVLQDYAVVHDRLERALAQKRRTARCIFEIFRSGLRGQETVRDENRYFLM